MVQRKVETIQEYVRLLKLSKAKYQKLLHENKTPKEKIEAIEKQRNIKKRKKKRKKQYKPEIDVEEEQEEQSKASEEEDCKSEGEPKTIIYKNIVKNNEKEKNIKPKKKDKKNF